MSFWQGEWRLPNFKVARPGLPEAAGQPEALNGEQLVNSLGRGAETY
jgi:hypothetical protein